MDSFQEACGATGLMLIDVERPDGSRTTQQAFHRPFVLIGRHPRADLVLDHDQVSKRHAYLQLVAGRLFWIDLDSRTGTFPGDNPAGSMGWVDPARAIRIGPFRIRVRMDDPGEIGAGAGPSSAWPSPLSSRSGDQFPLRKAILEVLTGESSSRVWPVNRALTLIGQSPLCKFRISGPTASRFYGALMSMPDGTWLVDLLSNEGISVNGARVRHVRLEDGDVLQIARHELRLRYDVTSGSSHPGNIPARVAPAHLGPIARGSTPTPPDWSHAVAGHLPDRSGPTGPELQPFLDQMARMQQQTCDQFQQAMVMISQLFGSIHRDHMAILREELDQIRRLTREMQAMREAPGHGPSNPAGQPALDGDPVPMRTVPAAAIPPDAGGDFLGDPGPAPVDRRSRLDPLEVHAMVGNRLEAYERERQKRWNRILRVLTGQQ